MEFRHQMALPVVVAVLLLTASTVQGSGQRGKQPEDGGQIVGGEDAGVEDFPWMVSVERKCLRSHYCGGSVMSERWVLTAAHCCHKSIVVRSGTSLSARGGLIHHIRQTVIHDLFEVRNDTADYDIALLEVETPFVWTRQLQPVRGLATGNPPAGTRVVVTGWGFINVSCYTADTLQKLDLVIQDWDECKRTIDPVDPQEVTERKICALPVPNKSTCSGDSGSPLIEKETGVQVGIAASVVHDCFSGFPTLYTSVANLREWIREKTGV